MNCLAGNNNYPETRNQHRIWWRRLMVLRPGPLVLLLLALTGLPTMAQDTGLAPISAESSAASDARIQKRLVNIYSNLKELKEVEVSVEEGIVMLSGEIYTREAEAKALELASRTENVVSIQNEMDYNQDIAPKLSLVGNDLARRGMEVLQFLPVLLLALGIFVVFWYFARWATSGRAYFNRLAPNIFIADLIRQIVRIALTLVGLVIALEVADATSILGSVMGALGLAGLALGFAVRDTVENYIASILLSLRQPFAPDDHVIIEGLEGLVLKLTSRATVLMSFDGNHIRIPNSRIYKGVIVNFTRNPRRRFTFDVGVGTDVNLPDALQLARDIMQDSPGVLDAPSPVGLIESLGDSNVLLRFYAWLDQRESDYSTVRSATICRVTQAFKQADFDMPEPIYRVNLTGVKDFKATPASPVIGVAKSSDHLQPAESRPVEPVESPEAALRAQVDADDSGANSEENLLHKNAPKE